MNRSGLSEEFEKGMEKGRHRAAFAVILLINVGLSGTIRAPTS